MNKIEMQNEWINNHNFIIANISTNLLLTLVLLGVVGSEVSLSHIRRTPVQGTVILHEHGEISEIRDSFKTNKWMNISE